MVSCGITKRFPISLHRFFFRAAKLRKHLKSALAECDPTTCYTQLLEELPLYPAASACPLRENVSQQELTAMGQRSIDGFRELSTPPQFPKTIERHCV